jgi:Raf kinase inhibitor-like YbhB/YbcL family protein
MTVWQGLKVGAMVAALAVPVTAQGNRAGGPPQGPGRGGPQGPGRGAGAPTTAAGPALALTSAAFEDGGIIPDSPFSQVETTPLSPAFSWTNPPAGTQTYVLIMHDADVAPMKNGPDFVHWLVFNIPGNARGLAQGIQPNAAGDITQGHNGRNTSSYLGPGAPNGPYHHYVFELFALDIRLPLQATATRDDVIAAMAGHVVGKAAYTGRWHRP